MIQLTCPRRACGASNDPRAIFCSECGARLSLSARQLTKAITTERPKRTYGQCHYCGRPCLGQTCAAHRKLVEMDPNMGGRTT